MKRKVIQLAGKTFVVSLPSKWVKKYGIKKGDEMELNEKSNNIILSTTKDIDIVRTNCNITHANERTIRWLLSSMHKKGYDEIELFYDDPGKTPLIQELIKDLFIGFAIVHQSNKRCVIRSVSKDQESEFDNMLRRAFLVTLSMAESSADYLEQNNLKQLSDLLPLEKTNNQLTNFCERILNKKGHFDYNKTNFYYVIIWNLEKICDDYKYICEYLSKQKTKISKQTIQVFKEVNKFLREYYELMYSFDILKLNKLTSNKKDIQNRIRSLMQARKGNEGILLNYLTSVLTKTSDFSASFMALNTD